MKLTDKKSENSSPDIQRRRIMQGVAVGAGAVAVPGLASAVCAGHSTPMAKEVVEDDSIYVEFSDPEANFVDGVLARVSIHNNSDQEIRLSHLSTGNVTTKHGVYDINSRLHRSPVAVGPNGVYHFWLKPDNALGLSPDTVPAPALSRTAKMTKLQLRVVRGESQMVSARQNRLVDADVRYLAG